MGNGFENKLREIFHDDELLLKEPMRLHTTFRIGGEATYFVKPSNIGQIQKTIHLCKAQGVSYEVVGNGSNLLVGDYGFEGVIIHIGKGMSQVVVEDLKLVVQGGALLSQVANAALEEGWTGMEFASGIPGTIGGATAMNAGAYGGEMKQVIVGATVLTTEGEIKTLDKEQLQLGYRTSIISQKGYIVVQVVLQLEAGNKENIKAQMEKWKQERIQKQPLDYPSAGSTFKRPQGNFAGKLIMDAQLAGFCVGGAQVSTKHCGFVINKGSATAKDMIALTDAVIHRVKEQFDVTLELEVKLVGTF